MPRTVETYENGVLVKTASVPVSAQETNMDALLVKARQALVANAAFLAIASPTAAQVAAQAKLLTRETNVLLRLLLSELDAITDT